MDKYTGKKLDGRYEIRELIGVGGMANVYRCYDTIDAREVAIKIMKDEFLDNEDFIRRFKNESKAIAVLNHPNIVRVYDVSFGDMIQYIVMEYIEGTTVANLTAQRGGRIPPGFRRIRAFRRGSRPSPVHAGSGTAGRGAPRPCP